MAKLKYRGTGGVVELLDISNVLNRLSSLEAKMTAVETKLTVKSDGLWRYLVLGSFVIGWRTDRFVVPQWNSWGNLWESSAKLSSVIYPGGYQGKFSQVALFCNAKNVGEVTSCGVEFEDSSTPDVLNKFPNVYQNVVRDRSARQLDWRRKKKNPSRGGFFIRCGLTGR